MGSNAPAVSNGSITNPDDPKGQNYVNSPWETVQNGTEGKGWSTGKFDYLSNKFDAWNPQVKKNPDGSAKGDASPWEAPVMPKGPDLKGWLDPNDPFHGLDPNAQYTPDILQGKGVGAEFGGLRPDQAALNREQEFALGKGPSPWLHMQDEMIDNTTGKMRDQAATDAASATSGAMNTAASHGGLSGGAAARIAGRGADSSVMGQQGANFQGEQGKLGAGIADEQNKMDILKSLPQQQLDLAKYNAGINMYDTTNANDAKKYAADNYIGGIKEGNANMLSKYGIDPELPGPRPIPGSGARQSDGQRRQKEGLMELRYFNPKEWEAAAERIHAAVFGDAIPLGFQRIDFSIVAEDEAGFIGYMTGVEINSQLLRFGFGGVIGSRRGSLAVCRAYEMALDWAKKGPWLSAVTIIKNDNLASLKLAMGHGFRVIGVQCYEGDVLLELQLKLKPGPSTMAPPQGG